MSEEKKLKSAGAAWADRAAAKHGEWERSHARDRGGKTVASRAGVHKPKTDYRRKPKHKNRGWE